MLKINVLIPMAGEGSRFDYKFKPLIKLDDRTFIEHVLDFFLLYDDNIIGYHFIITQEQENNNNVTKIISKLFPKILNKIKIHILINKTYGPYQTIVKGIGKINNIENVFICDCDHKINIFPIINYLLNNINIFDIIIPIWNITKEEHGNWGKLVVDENNKIINYYEKENVSIEKNNIIYGIIGCYFFKTLSILNFDSIYINITDFLKNNSNLNINTCKIKEAYFFGKPECVDKYIKMHRNYENIICDIDGVLIKHNSHSNTNLNDNIFIDNCSNKLLEWKNSHKKIILMTSRSKNTKNELITLLKINNIYFDELIMGVNPGTRYVINDIKPSNIFTKQAFEINVIRDKGISNILCNENLNNNIIIIKKLKGGSFSNTFLLEQNNNLFVRKYIVKSEENMEHYFRLKRQTDDLKRLNYYHDNLVPKILNEEDSNFHYFYDMEFLKNYKQLDCFDKTIQKKAVIQIMEKMNSYVYCYKKMLTIEEQIKFMDDYLNEKIYCKLHKFEKECNVMNYLINSKEVTINGVNYFGLRKIFYKLNIYNNFNPTFICPIHGDLNFENILYNDSNDNVMIIDMEGSRYVDTPLFDLGKLFQSLVSNYESWSKITNIIINEDTTNLICINDYFDFNINNIDFVLNIFKKILNNDDNDKIIRNGIFYMANYFIRFIPFRLKIDKKQGMFAMIMAIVWLNKIL